MNKKKHLKRSQNTFRNQRKYVDSQKIKDLMVTTSPVSSPMHLSLPKIRLVKRNGATDSFESGYSEESSASNACDLSDVSFDEDGSNTKDKNIENQENTHSGQNSCFQPESEDESHFYDEGIEIENEDLEPVSNVLKGIPCFKNDEKFGTQLNYKNHNSKTGNCYYANSQIMQNFHQKLVLENEETSYVFKNQKHGAKNNCSIHVHRSKSECLKNSAPIKFKTIKNGHTSLLRHKIGREFNDTRVPKTKLSVDDYDNFLDDILSCPVPRFLCRTNFDGENNCIGIDVVKGKIGIAKIYLQIMSCRFYNEGLFDILEIGNAQLAIPTGDLAAFMDLPNAKLPTKIGSGAMIDAACSFTLGGIAEDIKTKSWYGITVAHGFTHESGKHTGEEIIKCKYSRDERVDGPEKHEIIGKNFVCCFGNVDIAAIPLLHTIRNSPNVNPFFGPQAKALEVQRNKSEKLTDRPVQKVGAISGLTNGRIINDNACIFQDGMAFKNCFIITSYGKPFAVLGDSGSFVTDDTNAFGILFYVESNSHRFNCDIAACTRLDDCFQVIQKEFGIHLDLVKKWDKMQQDDEEVLGACGGQCRQGQKSLLRKTEEKIVHRQNKRRPCSFNDNVLRQTDESQVYLQKKRRPWSFNEYIRTLSMQEEEIEGDNDHAYGHMESEKTSVKRDD